MGLRNASRGCAKESCFLDRDKTTVETRLTYRTDRGTLHGIARTTDAYADWLLKQPVEMFPEDMQAYEDYFFDDPAACDLSEIREALEGVGEKGLVTPLAGELFTSFLGTVRAGGIAQTLLDLVDHPDVSPAPSGPLHRIHIRADLRYPGAHERAGHLR